MLSYIIDALYIIVAVVTIAIFTKRGFLISLYKCGRTIMAAVIAYSVGPMVGERLYDSFFYERIFSWTQGKIETIVSSAAGALNLEELIDQLPLLVKQLADVDALKQEYNISADGIRGAAKDIAAAIARPVASLISDVVAHIAVFFLALLALFIVFKLLNGIFKLPGLNIVNRIFGFLLGVFTACLFLMCATFVIDIVVNLVASPETIEAVESASLFRMFSGI